jgi:hypothetical protein
MVEKLLLLSPQVRKRNTQNSPTCRAISPSLGAQHVHAHRTRTQKGGSAEDDTSVFSSTTRPRGPMSRICERTVAVGKTTSVNKAVATEQKTRVIFPCFSELRRVLAHSPGSGQRYRRYSTVHGVSPLTPIKESSSCVTTTFVGKVSYLFASKRRKLGVPV